MDQKCTCRHTPLERVLHPDCPIHGHAEMKRRYENARKASRSRPLRKEVNQEHSQ